ncbi:MAG: O-antigen ligase family protein, partial [Candidatus Geothermincolia bacterium]
MATKKHKRKRSHVRKAARPTSDAVSDSREQPQLEEYRALSITIGVFAAIVPVVFVTGYQTFAPVRQLLIVVCAGLSLALLGYYWLKRRQIVFLLTGAELPWLAVLLIMTLATLFSISRITSVWGDYFFREGLVNWFSYAILFVASVQAFRTEKSRSLLFTCLRVSAVVIALLAILQVSHLDPLSALVPSTAGTASSFLGNPAYLGAYLTLLAPLFLLLATAEDRGRRGRILDLVLFALLVAAAIATQSRSTWLAMSITCGLALGYYLYRRSGMALKSVVEGVAAGIVVGALVFGLTIAVSGSFRQRITGSKGKGPGSVEVRLATWGRAVAMIGDRPLGGFGPGTFEQAIPGNLTSSWDRRFGHDPLPNDPHNLLAYAGFAMGIPGLLVIIWLLYAVFSKIVRRFSLAEDREKLVIAGLGLGCAAFVTGLMLQPSITELSALFWVLAGCALSVPLSLLASDGREHVRLMGKGIDMPRGAGLVITVAGIALVVIAAIFLVKPVAADARLKSAMDSWAKGDTQKGIEGAARAASLDMRYPEYLLVEGKMAMQSGQKNKSGELFLKSEQVLEEATKKQPLWETGRYTLGKSRLARFETFGSGDSSWRAPVIEKARSDFEEVVRRDPYYAAAQLALAKCDLYSWEYASGLDHARKALELRPGWSAAYNVMGHIFMHQGNPEQAREMFTRNKAARENAAVQARGTLSGVVTSAGTGAPVSGCRVDCYVGPTGEHVGHQVTDGSGHYRFTGLEATSYKLEFTPRDGGKNK